MGTVGLIRGRRAELRRRLDVARQFNLLEESCVPSYVHPNIAAAGVAWMRLLAAAKLYRSCAPPGPILDFGAATGELYHVLKTDQPYSFVEGNDALAKTLLEMNPGAARESLERLKPGAYSAVFALDALEHNENVAELLDMLRAGMAPGGVLIMSGPTENWLYRMGRKIAGFSGHYHKTTIRAIEEIAGRKLKVVRRAYIPCGVPLFSVSAWRQ